MLARLRKAKENGESGFTLIELLVVMIIIGILAAIAIPAFLSQKQKAQDTSAKADVSTIGKEVAAYYVDGTAKLTLAVTTGGWGLTEAGASAPFATGKLSGDNTVAGGADTANAFCVAVTAPNGSTKTFNYSANGLGKGACATTYPTP